LLVVVVAVTLWGAVAALVAIVNLVLKLWVLEQPIRLLLVVEELEHQQAMGKQKELAVTTPYLAQLHLLAVVLVGVLKP
jgi:hypothetical protein